MSYAIRGKSYARGFWKLLLDGCDRPQVYTTRAEADEVKGYLMNQLKYDGWSLEVVKVDIVVKPYTEQ